MAYVEYDVDRFPCGNVFPRIPVAWSSPTLWFSLRIPPRMALGLNLLHQQTSTTDIIDIIYEIAEKPWCQKHIEFLKHEKEYGTHNLMRVHSQSIRSSSPSWWIAAARSCDD
jgi:hypothetical protein